MVIVALITFFNGFSRLLALFGIESEETGGGLCCGKRGENSPEVEEKLRAGQAIVAAELKRAQAARQQLVNAISISKTKTAAGGGKSTYVNLDTSPPDEESQHHKSEDGQEDYQEEEEEEESKYSFNSSINKYKPTLDFDEETGAIRKPCATSGASSSYFAKGSKAVTKQPSAAESTKNPLVSKPPTSNAAANGKSLFGGKTVLEMTSKSKPAVPSANQKGGAAPAPAAKKPSKDVFSFDDDDEEELQKYRGRYD